MASGAPLVPVIVTDDVIVYGHAMVVMAIACAETPHTVYDACLGHDAHPSFRPTIVICVMFVYPGRVMVIEGCASARVEKNKPPVDPFAARMVPSVMRDAGEYAGSTLEYVTGLPIATFGMLWYGTVGGGVYAGRSADWIRDASEGIADDGSAGSSSRNSSVPSVPDPTVELMNRVRGKPVCIG